MSKKSELVQARFQIAENNTKTKFKLFNDCDEIYHNYGKQQFTSSQVKNPYSWSNVETITPRMVARRPTIVYKPREQSDELSSKVHTALFDYWWDKDNAFAKTVSWIKDALTYGTGITKVYWKTKKTKVTTYQYDETGMPITDENDEYITQEDETTIFDDPCLENVNIYDFFIDPEAKDIQSASWVIHRYWKSIEELEEAGYYKNLNKLKGLASTVEHSPEDQRRQDFAFGSTVDGDDTVEKVKILEMWDDDGLTVVAGGEVVIREQENPFWHGKKPFIRLVDSLVTNEFYGKGEIEPVKKLQHALNTIQNQIIDNRNQILMAMWKVKGTIDESELIIRPNGVIHETEYDTAEMVQQQDLTGNAQKDIAFIKSDIQQALGIYDYTKGAESSSNKTATGISMIQEAANARFAHKIQLFEEALKELGEFVLALYQQFLTEPRMLRIVGASGQDYRQIVPQEIAGEYDCVPEAGSTQPIDKEAQRNDIINAYKLFAQDPMIKDGGYEIKKRVLEELLHLDSVDQILKSPQELAQEQAMEAERMAKEQELQAEQEGKNKFIDHELELEKLNAKNMPVMA